MLEDALQEYSYRTFKPVDPVLHDVLDRARAHGMPRIHVGGMEGLSLEVMIRIGGYKKVVEVGTLAGYSGINIARAVGPGGVLHTIDCNSDFAKVAEESFKKAGVSDIVVMHVGNALDVLKGLSAQGPFDAVFVDADKHNYPRYLDWAEENIREGGAVFADNTFGFGHVWRDHIDNPQLAKDVKGIQAFNSRLANNPKFRATILPFNQGITMAVKISS